MSRVYKQPRPESNKKAAPVTETKDTGSHGITGIKPEGGFA